MKDVAKIFVRLLDGSIAYEPINAIQLAQNRFEIQDDNAYTDYVEDLYLHEFYPGDIVELADHTFADGTIGKVAETLVKQGQWQDRKFKEFKFNATVGQLRIDRRIADIYKDEIIRVLKADEAGQFLYPNLIQTARHLHRLLMLDNN